MGGFLFSTSALPDLEACDITNFDLSEAIRALAVTVSNGVRRPVDYKNLGAEELGSVYESLLELHPRVNLDAATFELSVASGHERKTTGSYYTPTSLIDCLLDSALDPVLDEAARKPDAGEGHSGAQGRRSSLWQRTLPDRRRTPARQSALLLHGLAMRSRRPSSRGRPCAM